MAGGYASTRGGPEGLAARILDLQRQVDQLRLAAGVKSAILRGDRMTWQTLTGSDLVQIGSLAFADGDTGQGLAVFDSLDGSVIAYLYRNLTTNLVRAQFGNDSNPLDEISFNGGDVYFDPVTNFFVVASDVVSIHAGSNMFLAADGGSLNLDATGDVDIDAGGNVDINPTGELRFFIGTTTNPANLNMSSNNIRHVSSGRRYKAAIADAVIDPADVLALRPRTWVDKGELERDPTYDRRTVGFIAEEFDELESMRQFVEYNDAGEPNSIFYDRVFAAGVVVDQAQQAEIDALKAENAEMKSAIADLVARVDALESGARS